MVQIKPRELGKHEIREITPRDSRKVPLTFEYVLLFFSLPAGEWNAGTITPRGWAVKDPQYTRHYRNIYGFTERKGIHETHDNFRNAQEDPYLWDRSTFLDMLNVHDYNSGVVFCNTLLRFDEKMRQQGRVFEYEYSGELLLIEKTPRKPIPRIEKQRRKPLSRIEKLRRGLALVASFSLLSFLFFYESSNADMKKPSDIFHEVILSEPKPKLTMYYQRQTAETIAATIREKNEAIEGLALTGGKAHPSKYRVTYASMYPGEI